MTTQQIVLVLESGLDVQLAAIAQNVNYQRRFRNLHRSLRVLHIIDGVIVDLNDNIARLEAGCFGRALGMISWIITPCRTVDFEVKSAGGEIGHDDA